MVSVGIVVNSASGRDVRRLVSAATVVDNAQKGSMAVRLLAGLASVGVDEILVMPLDPTVAGPIARVSRLIEVESGRRLPPMTWLDMPVESGPRDTCTALDMMADAGVSAICILGGDGTQRLAVGRIGDIPLTALSTGTNNVFSEWAEATVAGLATGYVATGRVPRTDACVREHARVVRCGDHREAALVDVAVTRSVFTGARASWRADQFEEVSAVFTSPTAIGLSTVVTACADAPRHRAIAARVRTGVGRPVKVPLAPGLIVEVQVGEPEYLALGQSVEIPPGRGAISLDGERLIERTGGQGASMELVEAVWRLDIGRVMATVAAQSPGG